VSFEIKRVGLGGRMFVKNFPPAYERGQLLKKGVDKTPEKDTQLTQHFKV